MKLLSCISVLLVSVGAICAGQETERKAAKAEPTRVVNRVAAVVNGRPITSSEVRARLGPYVNELMMLYPKFH